MRQALAILIFATIWVALPAQQLYLEVLSGINKNRLRQRPVQHAGQLFAARLPLGGWRRPRASGRRVSDEPFESDADYERRASASDGVR